MHGVPMLTHIGHALGAWGATLPWGGAVMHVLLPLVCGAVAGVLTGALTLTVVAGASRIFARCRRAS